MKLIKFELNNDSEDSNHKSSIEGIDSGYTREKQHSAMQSSVKTASAAAAAAGVDTKYCNICNINFNYASSFIAHKTYYCKSLTKSELGIGIVERQSPARNNSTPSPQSAVVTARAIAAETSVL